LQTFVATLCPAVPLAALAALHLARKRLQDLGVSVRNTQAVENTGKATTFLVEKSVLVSEKDTAASFLVAAPKEGDYPTFEKTLTKNKKLLALTAEKPMAKRYLECLGLCNSLTKVGDKIYGRGDEAEMLAQTGFELNNKIKGRNEMERYFSCTADGFSAKHTVRRFLTGATHAKSAKGVVVANAENELCVYVRGDPFDVEPLCAKNTVPYNFAQTVSRLASKGLKVSALAFKPVREEESAAAAETLEKDLVFAGLYCANSCMAEEVSAAVEESSRKARLVLVSDACVFSTLFAARGSGVVPTHTPILTGRTELVNNVETLVWSELSKKKTENLDVSEVAEPFKFIDVELISEKYLLNYDGVLALTGSALKVLILSYSSEALQAVLQKCSIYGECAEEEKTELVRALQAAEGAVGYVHDGFGSAGVQKAADVALCLRHTKLQASASLSADRGSLATLSLVLRHARAALDNQHKNFAFLAFFLALRTAALAFLVYRRTLFATSQLIFLDFAILLGFAYIQSGYAPPTPTETFRTQPLLSRKFFLALAPQTTFALTVLLLAGFLMSKTKFYEPPLRMVRDNDRAPSPDAYFFFDPFVLFITASFLCLFAIFAANSGNFLRKQVNWKIALFTYWFALGCLLTLLLFRLSKLPLVFQATRLFRIPILFGFERIIALVLVFAVLGFFLIRKFFSRPVEAKAEQRSFAHKAELSLVDRHSEEHSCADKKTKSNHSLTHNTAKPTKKTAKPKKPKTKTDAPDAREKKIKIRSKYTA